MEYVTSNAAVARSLTGYMGAAIGVSSANWRFTVGWLPKGFNEIDLVAVAVILVLTLTICYRLIKQKSYYSSFLPFSASISAPMICLIMHLLSVYRFIPARDNLV